MFNLAHMYASGVGVAPDDQTALEWFRKSAERGYPDAFLGRDDVPAGRGVPRSDTQAYAWFAVAPRSATPKPEAGLMSCSVLCHPRIERRPTG